MNKGIRVSLLMLFIFLNSCSKSEQNADEVVIGYSALRISLPVFVAVEKGYFRDEGLKVKLVRFDTAQPLMQSLVAGKIPVAGYTALPITFNAMLRSKEKLYFITSLVEDDMHPISYLILPHATPKDFTMNELRGKKIGVLPTVAYHKWLEHILKSQGISRDEVTITPVTPNLQANALQSGAVHAVFTNDPAATAILQQGVGRLYSDESISPKYLGNPMLFGSFNIAKGWADSHPEQYKKIVRALNKSVDFVNENPQKAKQAMVPYVHETQKNFVSHYANAKYLRTDQSDSVKYQATVKQYLELGIIPEKLNLEELIIK